MTKSRHPRSSFQTPFRELDGFVIPPADARTCPRFAYVSIRASHLAVPMQSPIPVHIKTAPVFTATTPDGRVERRVPARAAFEIIIHGEDEADANMWMC